MKNTNFSEEIKFTGVHYYPEGESPLQACWIYVKEAVGGDMSLLVSRKPVYREVCSEGTEDIGRAHD